MTHTITLPTLPHAHRPLPGVPTVTTTPHYTPHPFPTCLSGLVDYRPDRLPPLLLGRLITHALLRNTCHADTSRCPAPAKADAHLLPALPFGHSKHAPAVPAIVGSAVRLPRRCITHARCPTHHARYLLVVYTVPVLPAAPYHFRDWRTTT